VRSLSRVAPLPRLPAQGDVLKLSYVRHFAHAAGEDEALGALARSALNQTRERGDALLLFALAENDPLTRTLHGLPSARYHYGLSGTLSGTAIHRSELSANGVFYDDPALA
jgi:hypothetical protein